MVNIETKQSPTQKRSKQTYDIILETTAQLLDENGTDKLSTNKIAKKAGLTPPALYRYFPNKYAIMAALGQNLMDAQDKVFFQWLKNIDHKALLPNTALSNDTKKKMEEDFTVLMLGIHTASKSQTGALYIMRALYAVPALQEVRLSAHRATTDILYLATTNQTVVDRTSTHWLRIRLIQEACYSTYELGLEEPDLDITQLATETSKMVANYWLPEDFLAQD